MFSEELKRILAKEDEEQISQCKVTFMPMNKTFVFGKNKSILNLARKEEIHIRSICHGQASCAECVVKITEGMKHLNKSDYPEQKLIGNVAHITHERLACQCYPVNGDIVVDVGSHQKLENQEKIDLINQKEKAQERDAVYLRNKTREEQRQKQIEMANRLLDEKKIREEDEK